jgi:hypothetical protein
MRVALTLYTLDAIYLVLICQPLLSSFEPAQVGTLERTLPAKGLRGNWVAEAAFKFKVVSVQGGP